MTLGALAFHGIRGVLLQNFVENFSEFSAAQRNAGKHVTIMSELSRLVDTRTLMQVCTALAARVASPCPCKPQMPHVAASWMGSSDHSREDRVRNGNW